MGVYSGGVGKKKRPSREKAVRCFSCEGLSTDVRTLLRS